MNIVVVGYGAMGIQLVEKIGTTTGYTLVGVVDKQSNLGVNSFADLKSVPDVIIDFSHPSYLNEMLDYACDNKVGLVIATTGFNAKELQEIKTASKLIPILQTSNTSLGVNLLLEVIKQITPVLEEFDIEVIEKHHNKKIDSPSGTAKVLVEELLQNSNKTRTVHGRNGFEKRESNEIGVHAVRGGTIPGEHTIIYAGEDEIIEIKHSALSKQVFVTGALKAADYITSADSGLYTMSNVLMNKGEYNGRKRNH